MGPQHRDFVACPARSLRSRRRTPRGLQPTGVPTSRKAKQAALEPRALGTGRGCREKVLTVRAAGGPSGERAQPAGDCLRSAGRGGDLVAVELREVVGRGDQPPFGQRGGSAASLEAVDLAVVFGVSEDRLDGLLALAVDRLAVLG